MIFLICDDDYEERTFRPSVAAWKNIAPAIAVWLYSAMPETGNMAKSPATTRCRVCIFYSGHVQGVGFRYTTRSVASGFEVTGTVRNLPDGRVELVAEGARSELEAFREAIRDAGLGACIRREEVAWSDARGDFRGFEIVQ